MSLISDALKKAQRDRTISPAGASPATSPRLPRRGGPEGRAVRRVLLVVNIAVLMAVLVGGIAYFHGAVKSTEPVVGRLADREVMRAPPSTATAVTPVATVVPAPAPRMPELPISSAPQTPLYDLAGMTMVGPNTLLSISRRSDRRSVWIPIGKTVGEVTAVSYDPRTDRALIEVDGQTLTIKMRDGATEEPKIRAAE